MNLEDVWRDGPGTFADRGVEGINLGLAIDQNTSGYKIYLPKEMVIRVTNQVTFDELYFPMKEAAMAALRIQFLRPKMRFRLRMGSTWSAMGAH